MSEEKIAKSTCTLCHNIKPRTQMRQVSKTVRSGHSIGGNTSHKGISARQYYSKKKEWVCNECYVASRGKGLVGLAFWCFVGYMVFSNWSSIIEFIN